MAVTSLDTLINSLNNSVNFPFYKKSIATQVSGQFCSLWRGTGGYPLQGAIPAGAATCDDTLVGTFPLPTAATKLYIAKIDNLSSIITGAWVYDRLAHMGGLNGTLLTAQTVNVSIATAAASGRCAASGSDVDWFLEWYTATGATASNATVNVTYDDNSTGNLAAIAVGGTAIAASQMRQLIPAVAGRTIKQVNTVTLSASTTVVGSFGVTAGKRLFGYTVPIANTSVSLDFGATGLAEIKDSSCLWLVTMPSTTSSGIQMGNIVIANG